VVLDVRACGVTYTYDGLSGSDVSPRSAVHLVETRYTSRCPPTDFGTSTVRSTLGTTDPIMATGAATSTPGKERTVSYCPRLIPPKIPDSEFGRTSPRRASTASLDPAGRTRMS